MSKFWVIEHQFVGDIPPDVNLNRMFFTGEITPEWDGVLTPNLDKAARFFSPVVALELVGSLKPTIPTWPNAIGAWRVREEWELGMWARVWMMIGIFIVGVLVGLAL